MALLARKKKFVSVHMDQRAAVCSSPSSMMSIAATDALAASLAATAQHAAEHAGLEHVVREQHETAGAPLRQIGEIGPRSPSMASFLLAAPTGPFSSHLWNGAKARIAS